MRIMSLKKKHEFPFLRLIWLFKSKQNCLHLRCVKSTVISQSTWEGTERLARDVRYTLATHSGHMTWQTWKWQRSSLLRFFDIQTSNKFKIKILKSWIISQLTNWCESLLCRFYRLPSSRRVTFGPMTDRRSRSIGMADSLVQTSLLQGLTSRFALSLTSTPRPPDAKSQHSAPRHGSTPLPMTSVSPDVILCGWLGLKHQLTN